MQEETVFFDRGGVRVTTDRLVVNEQIYDIDGVTWVKQGIVKASRLGPLLIGFFGVAALFNGAAYVAWGVFLIVAAAVWWARQESEAVVVLKWPAREIQVLKSPDAAYAQGVADALHQALAARGETGNP